MNDYDKAYWLADKIGALGDYAKEAAYVLRRQADELERLTKENEELREGISNMVIERGELYTELAALKRENEELRKELQQARHDLMVRETAKDDVIAALKSKSTEQPVAWRLRNTAFRKPVYRYYDTRQQAEIDQADFNRSVDCGSLRELTPLFLKGQ